MAGEFGTGKKKKTVEKTERPLNYAFLIKIVIAFFAIIAIAFLAYSYSGSDAEEQKETPDETINPETGVAVIGANAFSTVKVPIERYSNENPFGILTIPSELNTMYLTDRTPGDPTDRGIIVFEKEAFMKGIQFTFYENSLETKGNNEIIILDKKADHVLTDTIVLTKFPATTREDFANFMAEGKYVFVILSQQ